MIYCLIGFVMESGPNRRMLRHVKVSEKPTTILMEPSFWAAIDRLAAADGIHWRELVQQMLAAKPEGQGATSWLRVCCLTWPDRAA